MFKKLFTKRVLAITIVLLLIITLYDLLRIVVNQQQCDRITMNGVTVELDWMYIPSGKVEVKYPGYQFNLFSGTLHADGTFEVTRPFGNDFWSFDEGIIKIPILLESNPSGTFLDSWFIKNCDGRLYYSNIQGIEVLPPPPVIDPSSQSEV